jgi:uncharacterized protein (DUF433 family)
VLRGTRVRPQDIVGNAEMGVAWIADPFGTPEDDVRTVLAFHAANWDELPMEYARRSMSRRSALMGLIGPVAPRT